MWDHDIFRAKWMFVLITYRKLRWKKPHPKCKCAKKILLHDKNYNKLTLEWHNDHAIRCVRAKNKIWWSQQPKITRKNMREVKQRHTISQRRNCTLLWYTHIHFWGHRAGQTRILIYSNTLWIKQINRYDEMLFRIWWFACFTLV